jgi:hypothetical protein
MARPPPPPPSAPVVAERHPCLALPRRPCPRACTGRRSPLPFLGDLFSSAVAAPRTGWLVPEVPPRRPLIYRWTRRSRTQTTLPCGGLMPPISESKRERKMYGATR